MTGAEYLATTWTDATDIIDQWVRYSCVLQANAGVKQMLTTVEQAVGQLRTAVVALELRPPVEGTEVDTLQVCKP